MTATELVRRLRRLGRKRGVAVAVRRRRGKGSHMLLDFGGRWTTIPGHPGDLPPGTLKAICRQLGVDPREL